MNTKRKLIIPTEAEDAAINASIATDSDTFEASSVQFQTAKRGRGLQKAATKVPVSIRLSPDVVAAFRSMGRGWQGRIDEALKDWLEHHRAA